MFTALHLTAMDFDIIRNQSNITSHQRLIRSPIWLYTTTVLCSIGIVSAVLAICTIWDRTIKHKTSFFIIMFIGTILDLLFNIFYFIYQWSDSSSLWYVLSCGFAFSTSLAIDLCSFALTVQRYLALTKPHLKLTPHVKLTVRIITAASICLISLSRFQYIFDRETTILYVSPTFIKFYKSHFYVYISTSANMILPFVLIIFISFFSFRIIFIVRERNRRRSVLPETTFARFVGDEERESSAIEIRPNSIATVPLDRRFSYYHASLTLKPPSTLKKRPSHATVVVPDIKPETVPPPVQQQKQQKQCEKRMKADSIIPLVLLLDCMFMLNQAGYCLFTIVDIYTSYCVQCPQSDAIHAAAEVASDLCECISHSLNFILYLKFSKMMKLEFFAFLTKCKKLIEKVMEKVKVSI